MVIGGTVTLWCAATQVTRAPDFQWTLPGGITHSTPPETEDSSITSLALKEIKTSQAGQYNCTATVIGSKTDSTYIVVQSKCPYIVMMCVLTKLMFTPFYHNYILYLVPSPKPSINYDKYSPVAGTLYVLTCNYTLSSFVDTDITASATWTINGRVVPTYEDGGRISTNGTDLTFSPLTTLDSGRYKCNVTLTPSSQTPHVIVEGQWQSEVKNITVQSNN